MPKWTVTVTATYQSESSDPFTAALHIIDAIGFSSGSRPVPVGLRIEVSEDA